MGMINSQGFRDGYEDNDFKYDVLEIDKSYFDQYHEGRHLRTKLQYEGRKENFK